MGQILGHVNQIQWKCKSFTLTRLNFLHFHLYIAMYNYYFYTHSSNVVVSKGTTQTNKRRRPQRWSNFFFN